MDWPLHYRKGVDEKQLAGIHNWHQQDANASSHANDLYARVWECEEEKPVFEAEKDSATPPNSPKNPMQSDLSTEETWNTPGKAQECSREIFPWTGELSDVTDTYSYMKLDAGTSSEQLNKSLPKPRSTKYKLPHNMQPNCDDDYRYSFKCCASVFHGTHT